MFSRQSASTRRTEKTVLTGIGRPSLEAGTGVYIDLLSMSAFCHIYSEFGSSRLIVSSMLKGLLQAARRVESMGLSLELVPDFPSEVLVQSSRSGAYARGIRVDLLILGSLDDRSDRNVVVTRLSAFRSVGERCCQLTR